MKRVPMFVRRAALIGALTTGAVAVPLLAFSAPANATDSAGLWFGASADACDGATSCSSIMGVVTFADTYSQPYTIGVNGQVPVPAGGHEKSPPLTA